MEPFEKLAPFMVRARIVVVGRERLARLRKKLAFVLVTEDISANSLRKILECFPCDVVRVFLAPDLERMFGYRNTKVVGFRRSDLARAARRALAECVVTRAREDGPCRK